MAWIAAASIRRHDTDHDVFGEAEDSSSQAAVAHLRRVSKREDGGKRGEQLVQRRHPTRLHALYCDLDNETPWADAAIQSRPMAKSSVIQQYARIGAAARIKEVQEEIAAITRTFPDLATSGPARQSPAVAPQEPDTQAVLAGRRKRKRRKMSAAARKAISDAQKARWATHKSTKGNS
jgi:hypothetical protein